MGLPDGAFPDQPAYAEFYEDFVADKRWCPVCLRYDCPAVKVKD